MKLKKIALIVVWLSVVSAVGVFFWFVSRLPSRSEVAGFVRSAAPPAVGTKVPSKSSGTPEPTAAESGSPATDLKKSENSDGLRHILALAHEDARDVRVCENLGHSRVDFTRESPDLRMDELLGEDRTDSFGESFRFPVRAMLQEPSVAELMNEIQGMENEVRHQSEVEKESLFQKIGFYARVGRAASALYSRRQEYENLGNRATHLGVIARLAILKPELKDNSRLVDLCRTLQDFSQPIDRISLIEERKNLGALIAELGLKPQEVGFKPESWIRFSVKADKKGFSFSLSDSGD